MGSLLLFQSFTESETRAQIAKKTDYVVENVSGTDKPAPHTGTIKLSTEETKEMFRQQKEEYLLK